MKFSFDELSDLVTPSGGRFAAGNLADAYLFCRKLAFGHYENFPVASILIPRNKRDYVAAIYAFARIADDIADELVSIDVEKRLEMLDNYEANIKIESTSNPVFLALNNTIDGLNLPLNPFTKLLTAFRMDVKFSQPKTIDDLYLYCQYSANPVGELVLMIFNEQDSQNIILSDKICTALQLTNFWQDFSRDLPNNRLYIPENLLIKYDLNKENLQVPQNSSKLRDCLVELYELTNDLFVSGKELVPRLKSKLLRAEIALTIESGMKILSKTNESGNRILELRPDLKKSEFIMLFFKSLFKYKFFMYGVSYTR